MNICSLLLCCYVRFAQCYNYACVVHLSLFNSFSICSYIKKVHFTQVIAHCVTHVQSYWQERRAREGGRPALPLAEVRPLGRAMFASLTTWGFSFGKQLVGMVRKVK